MPITISNTSLVVDGSKVSWSIPSPVIFIGEITRVFNSSSTNPTYSYTNTSGISTSSNISNGSIVYFLEKSGSASDRVDFFDILDVPTGLVSIRLFITSSELGGAFTEELITTTGAGTWTKPEGVTQVVVECWAGGGAGGGSTVTNGAGGGGAGGQYARKYIMYSSPSQNISYTVGSGGIGGTGNGASGNDTTWATNLVVAKGGGGGTADIVSELNPLGGGIASDSTNGVGDVVYVASNGFGGYFDPVGAAGAAGTFGGNGGYCPSNAGPSGLYIEYSGPGATGVFVSTGGTNGLPGEAYGGGGGGAARVSSGPSRLGGNGAQGLIRILYR